MRFWNGLSPVQSEDPADTISSSDGDAASAPETPCARKNTSDTCQVIGETEGPSSNLPRGEQKEEFCRQPSPMLHPVSLKGRMTQTGYEPENYPWLDVLTHKRKGRRVGRDPMKVKPEMLTAAGHGSRRTRSIIAALGEELVEEGIRRHKDLRKHCLSCAENRTEVTGWCPRPDSNQHALASNRF
jgi:hypothetical protein